MQNALIEEWAAKMQMMRGSLVTIAGVIVALAVCGCSMMGPSEQVGGPLTPEDVNTTLRSIDPAATLQKDNKATPDSLEIAGVPVACSRLSSAVQGANWLEGDVDYSDAYGAVLWNIDGRGEDKAIAARLFRSADDANAYVRRLIDDAPGCSATDAIADVASESTEDGSPWISWNEEFAEFSNHYHVTARENAVFLFSLENSGDPTETLAEFAARLH